MTINKVLMQSLNILNLMLDMIWLINNRKAGSWTLCTSDCMRSKVQQLWWVIFSNMYHGSSLSCICRRLFFKLFFFLSGRLISFDKWKALTSPSPNSETQQIKAWSKKKLLINCEWWTVACTEIEIYLSIPGKLVGLNFFFSSCWILDCHNDL